jgi:hypothetical protein
MRAVNHGLTSASAERHRILSTPSATASSPPVVAERHSPRAAHECAQRALQGRAVIAGAGLRIAAVAGTLLMLFMFMAEWPTATALVDGKVVSGSTNPIVDSHWHEALLLIISAVTLAGDTWGLGKWWGNLDFVKNHRSLR